MRRGAALVALLAGAAQADIAAITSQNAGALTLFDTGRGAVIATVPLPGKPAAVAVDPSRRRALAVAVESRLLHVFDLDGHQIAAWPVEGAPFGIAIRDNGMALVTDWTGWLREIDPGTGRELARWPTGATPSGVDAAEGLIVTADRDADAITIIRDASRLTVPVGHHPFGVTIHGGRVFVTNVLSDSVSVVDPQSGEVIATIPTGERPYAIAFAGGRGFVSNQYAASVTVFDAATLQVLGEIETGEYPEGIAATADKSAVLVANWFSDTLAVIDPETMRVTDEIPMPEGPRAFGRFVAD